MNLKGLLIVLLALLSVGFGRPRNRVGGVGTASPESESESQPESRAETKIREKRKYEIPLLRQLEEGGVGVKREFPQKEAHAEGSPAGAEAAEGKAGLDTEMPPEGPLRVKKQSPNNIGGCGKTVCGPVVSARGPVVGDMRAMMQGGKPIISLGDFHSAAISEIGDTSSKVDRFTPVQARTVDTIVAPIALGTLGYGTPAAYSAQPPALDLAHSFFKPPSMPTVPAVAVIAAPHQPSHPLVHLMPHLMPHIMPHLMAPLMSNFGSYFTPHRLEPSRFPDAFQADLKQPLPAYPPPSYALNGDNTLLCQPFRNQRLDGPYDYIYKPDSPADKSINVTDATKKSHNVFDADEDDKVYDHLKKVNEIKDEIRQLNRAAQRIVDQQERLTALQQKQLWGTSTQSSTSSADHLANPYMGSGYYSHPAMPWGYSRSNIFSYPRSQNDIDFFISLLQAGKKMGLLSDVVQPSVLSTIGDALKGVTDTGKSQKDATDAAVPPNEPKPTRVEKKSAK